MSYKIRKRRDKYRVFDEATGNLAKDIDGDAIDNGGYDTKEEAEAMYSGIESSHDKRHWLFACKYVELNRNGTKAYLAIYGDDVTYDSASVLAHTLLRKVKIQDYVKSIESDAITAAKVTAESVIARYQKWASFNASDVFGWIKEEVLDNDDKSYNPKQFRNVLVIKNMEEIPPEAWECIESVNHGKDGFKINVVNRKGANDSLARILGIDKQVIDHRGTIGITITSDEEDL